MILTTRTYILGTIEYVGVTVTADEELDAQSVAISLDHGETWIPSSWQGDPGLTRTAQTDAPVTFSEKTNGRVLVKVTDSPEVPIVSAGSYSVIST